MPINSFIKKIKACLAVGLSLCLLCGCAAEIAESTPAATPQPTTSATQPATKSTAANQALTGTLTVYVEQNYTDGVEHPLGLALRQFEAENPSLTIEYASPPIGDDPDGVREASITRLQTEIMAGGGPDIFLFGWRHSKLLLFPDLQKSMRNGAFLDCKALLSGYGVDTDSGEFWPCVMASGQVDGAQYVLPLSLDIPIAVGATDTITQSGFDESAARQSSEVFYAEIARVYAESGLPSYDSVSQATNTAQPMLDYSTDTVNIAGELGRSMLELDKANFNAEWNIGEEDFKNEYNAGGSGSFSCMEAQRLANGERLFCTGVFSNTVDVAWAMASNGTQAAFLPIPNEEGGVTARVGCCAAINANSDNPQAAAALAAFLLGEQQQSAAAFPDYVTTIAVRRGSLAAAVESMRQFFLNPWYFEPTEAERQEYYDTYGIPLEEYTEEQMDEYRRAYGAELTDDDIASLAAACADISSVYLYDILDHSVDIGKTADGDDLLNTMYDEYLHGVITLDELLDRIEPRLALYLDE